MFTVSPSIYSADMLNLRQVLRDSAAFEHIHLDIDDGNFVRGISFGVDLVESLVKESTVPMDVHLEVLNPMDYVEPLAKAGVSQIVAHVEALPFPSLFLSSVHSHGIRAGLALNIKTPVVYLEPYKDDIDQVIIVSVEADVEGLPFRKGILKKVREARELLGPDVSIWVDGGVNDDNLQSVVEAGADGVVIGRAVFKAPDPTAAYNHYLEAGRAYEAACGR